jgi:hypothetical protein
MESKKPGALHPHKVRNARSSECLSGRPIASAQEGIGGDRYDPAGACSPDLAQTGPK